MTKESFGAFITEKRERIGISKAELARRTGMTRAYIGFIEDDSQPPSMDAPNVSAKNLSALARELGVPEPEMFNRGYRSPDGFKLVPNTSAAAALVREKAATHQEFHLTADQMDALITDLERYTEMRLQLTAEQSRRKQEKTAA